MQTVISKDGTSIAYDRQGTGPAAILVDGALCFRSFGPMAGLAKLLSPYFTVYNYDRRGRGDSGDTQPYAIEREVEDLEALIAESGGQAFVFGTSSGACLALESAIRLGDKFKKLAMYEPPYHSDPTGQQAWKTYRQQLAAFLSADRRGEAAALFMQYVGTPAEMVEGMRQAPVWQVFESVAPTLAYDAAAIGTDSSIPTGRAASITLPTLAINGGAGLPFMEKTAEALAKAIPQAQHRILEGQTHDVNLEVLAPVLVEFFQA